MLTNRPWHFPKVSFSERNELRAKRMNFDLILVRSFGTEDRPTDRPVPARDEIFEYIIFRGADIEDLQVREPPSSSLTQDPAIVEASFSSAVIGSIQLDFCSFQSSAYSDNARSTTIGTNTSLAGTTMRRSRSLR